MIYKNFPELTEKERRKIVQGSIVPRPIAWIATQSENDTINLAPFSYFTILSPQHLTVSILRENGIQKDTARNIDRTKEAVVHIANTSQVEVVDATAVDVSYGESELAVTDLTLVESTNITTPGITEAPIRFETKFVRKTELLNDEDILADVFILEIIAVHMNEAVYDEATGYIQIEKLQPLTRLSGPLYGGKIEQVSFLRKK